MPGPVSRTERVARPAIVAQKSADGIVGGAITEGQNGGVGKKDGDQTQPEGIRAKGFAKIIGNTRAEEISQRGKEQVERMREANEVSQF